MIGYLQPVFHNVSETVIFSLWSCCFGIIYRSRVDVEMTIQVVCVINLTSTKTREDKNAEQSLEARKAAYAEVEKACAW